MSNDLNNHLRELFASEDDVCDVLQSLVEVIGKGLRADRCCLFADNPVNGMSRLSHQWMAQGAPPLQRDDGWSVSERLGKDHPKYDPLWEEAFVNPEALYIDDIRTAGPEVLNRDLEERFYGHRALIHAPLYLDGAMYGILEPCVFGEPRPWSAADRALVEQVQGPLAKVVAKYVAEHCPSQ